MGRRIVALTAALALVGLIAAPVGAASGPPARYQVATTTYKVMVLDTYEHDYTFVMNPCNATMTLASAATPVASGYYTTESLVFSVTAGVVTFTSTYLGPYNIGYSFSGSFPVAGGSLSGDYTGTVTATTTTTQYKNHGDYVSATGGGADAAHSCIGMPIQ